MTMAPKSWGTASLLLISLATLAACSYPVRNQALPPVKPTDEYDWKSLPSGDDTLVIVTASGGGTRAAALEMSVLQAMDRIRLVSGKTLAQRIDILSSVSGGSVTAAYVALNGVEKLRPPGGQTDLEKDFLRRDGMGAIAWAGLNPVGLAELATPNKERIDLLIDYLDRQLFRDATFADLRKRVSRPYLILNAGDMVEGTPFPFTQYTLDLLCSDLGSVKISTAVAASAAFPVALSPVTLKNYSGSSCTAERETNWVTNAEQYPTDWYVNPALRASERTAAAYFHGTKQYVHLLDGGISDNLGVSEPFRLLTGSQVAPHLTQEIATGQIRKIVFVMINARSFKPSRLDTEQATPGMLDMALGSIDSSIDRATFNTAERLRTLLGEEFRRAAQQAIDAAGRATDPALRADLIKQAANFRKAAANTRLLTVDFDAIEQDECRKAFHGIATSWTLSDQEIDALLLAGGALLAQDRSFNDMLAIVAGQFEGPLPRMADACAKVPKAPGG